VSNRESKCTQNASFRGTKLKTFLGRGHYSSPDPSPIREGIPLLKPHPLGTSGASSQRLWRFDTWTSLAPKSRCRPCSQRSKTAVGLFDKTAGQDGSFSGPKRVQAQDDPLAVSNSFTGTLSTIQDGQRSQWGYFGVISGYSRTENFSTLHCNSNMREKNSL